MSKTPNKWVALWREINRRHVIRATVGYVLISVAVVEAASNFLPPLIPDNADAILRVVVVMAIVGLPVTVALAWVYDLTPWGPRRTPELPPPEDAQVVDVSPARDAPADTAARPRSIAVLPFVDRSAQQDQEYFADGVAEELINQLARRTDLSVAARTSSFAFRGEHRDIREIGRELNVDTVLEGSVRKAGGRLRINAHLVSVEDGYQVWGARYDREEGDIFAIQDEIASQVCENLQASERAEVPEAVQGPGTENVEAYDLYLRGRHFWTRRHRVGLEHALTYFERAAAHDPEFPLPWSGIADVFTVLGIYSFLPESVAGSKALGAAGRALKLGPHQPEPHISFARATAFFEWDWAKAEEHHAKGLALDPDNGEAWASAAQLSIIRGRVDEALQRAERAADLAPDSSFAAALVGEIYLYANQEARAAEYLGSWRERDPEHPPVLYLLGEALAQVGRIDEAIPVLNEAVTITHRALPFVAILGAVMGKAGREEEARELLRELETRSATEYVTPLGLAMIHTGLGEADDAFRLFEEGMSSDPATATQTVRDTTWRPLWSHPRWTGILERMGLERLPWQEPGADE